MTEPGAAMIIPTDGGLKSGDVKWEPMREWLRANLFDLDMVPTDAWICIRGEFAGVEMPCLGVERFERDAAGRMRINPATDAPERRVEWHPMVQPPAPVLLPEEG